ncbi:DUF805 domain-containing protein [Agromyces sp. CFH 90414]|uniref:DUF805 domain-containing protein n=1 Tax=Agromyces agglutinans TaxID=2662258 RepID=A0A6I2FBU6_9MICO|nr:DUF805 domain-containing protein [Agromyces agglutinans]MRG59916.1 DUF805 domain-containing protein [Agromyces agglutinans]
MSTVPPPPQSYAASTGDVPLSQPLYGATIGQAVTRFFKKYATFSGRASRSEYWWWFLVNALVVFVLSIILVPISLAGATIDPATGTAVPGPGFFIGYAILGVWLLAVLVPSLAVIWRRLHDTNRSGGFFFLSFIPAVGSLILLVLLALDTDPAGSRFDA